MAFIFHFSPTCPVLKLFYLKNIFILPFWFPLLASIHFCQRKEVEKQCYMLDGGNPLRVIEIKDNGLYSVAAMREHAILKNWVRV